jgi:flavodoxin I
MQIGIVFSSVGGHTEMVVSKVQEILATNGHTVELSRVESIDPIQLYSFDLVILASPTYNQGTVEDKFVPFLNSFEKLDFESKKFAVIGLGSLKYYGEYLTESASILEEYINAAGGEIIINSLRINGHPAQFLSSLIQSWTTKLLTKLESI